jgi:DNA invertase Pin-like site-specific DNA recombinase
VYCDRAISGATTLRPDYQRLLSDARQKTFDVVVAEGLDRLSRDPEATAAFYKLATFQKIQIQTVAEGEVNDLHVGLKGTMNALFLKDLAIKTHRGIEGRVRQGRSEGGRAYGYRATRAAGGEAERGTRIIVDCEAKIVRRIFERFAAGLSPRAIARELNGDDTAAGDGVAAGGWVGGVVEGEGDAGGGTDGVSAGGGVVGGADELGAADGSCAVWA